MNKSLLLPAFAHFCLIASALAQEADPADQLASRDIAVRLRGVSRIADRGHEDAAKILADACGDKDWEVVERATAALAKHGDDKALKPLVRLALDSPLASIRRNAATALAAINPEEARKRLTKGLRGKRTERALTALGFVGFPNGGKTLRKQLKAKEAPIRRAAIGALATPGDDAAVKALTPHLESQDHTARAAAVEALARCGTDAALNALLASLVAKGTLPTLQRRINDGIVDLLRAREGDDVTRAVKTAIDTFDTAASGRGARAAARLIKRLHEEGFVNTEDAATKLVEKVDAKRGRGAVATVLGRIGGDAAKTWLAEVAKSDEKPNTRLLAVRAAAMLGVEAARDILHERLENETDSAVRQEVATLCGKLLDEKSAPLLRSALEKALNWEDYVTIAVSLGKLQDAEAVPLLAARLSDESHLIRASAAAGLGRIARAACVEPLIGALNDSDPLVAETALDYLQRMCGQSLPRNQKKWAKWWEESSGSFRFEDRVSAARRAKVDDERYDRFRRDPYGAFKDVRVIVLSKARDKMELSLEKLQIAHVLTETGKVVESGLHPNAVFLANCPGVLTADDAQRVSWFVRAGGHLFATCTALHNTVMTVFPGKLKHAPKNSGGPGPVDGFPVAGDEGYLRGVFDHRSRPRYQLAGTHLPVPIDPDIVHVLVDSTDACTNWGSGSLAAWFSVGHGVVFDSANHFVLQGMAAERLKTIDERRAYALERLGLDFPTIRDLDRRGVFKSKSKAAKECDDRTMMRLVARFVFTKRRSD